MITATVKGFERFGEVDAAIEELTLKALADAAETAAAVAQANASINLDIDVIPAEGTVDGFSSGILSRRTGVNDVRLAPIYDGGSLGRRHRKLKSHRRNSWQVNRQGSTFTAHRHQIRDDEGIPAENFFSKARTAGRKALLLRFDRGI